MNDKWFLVNQGVAHGVEYVAEDSVTTAINFCLDGSTDSLIYVPGLANNRIFIKESDQVEFCGRPALFDKNTTVCLAYRINKEGPIHSINELRHISVAILGCIFGTAFVLSAGWKWPLTLIAVISLYYAISGYSSFYARGCLARVNKQNKTESKSK
jgi:hypothetical protein